MPATLLYTIGMYALVLMSTLVSMQMHSIMDPKKKNYDIQCVILFVLSFIFDLKIANSGFLDVHPLCMMGLFAGFRFCHLCIPVIAKKWPPPQRSRTS